MGAGKYVAINIGEEVYFEPYWGSIQISRARKYAFSGPYLRRKGKRHRFPSMAGGNQAPETLQEPVTGCRDFTSENDLSLQVSLVGRKGTRMG
jgi:hypothetical protein